MRNSSVHVSARGIALITAIWILAVLMVLVAGFAAMVHSEAEIARNFGELTRARWSALAGLVRAEAEIRQRIALPYTTLDGGASLTLDSEEEQEKVGEGTYTAVIEDAAGKINLNTASAEILQAFFPADVADAIIDWRDTDSTPQAQGAEDAYYTALSTPYHCKNAPFATVDELLLVKGVTRELLATGVGDSGLSLRALLTVYSVDRNADAQGRPRVNVRTATREQLTTAFGSTFTTQEIDAIIARRTATPFTSPAYLLEVPGLSREKVAQVYDLLTASTETTAPGLINLNTAPAEVLAALPGMDAALAQAVVQRRSEQGPFKTVGQLLDMTQIGNSEFERIADLLTTRSQTFHITATGTMPDEIAREINGVVRATASGERSGETAILYWHE